MLLIIFMHRKGWSGRRARANELQAEVDDNETEKKARNREKI
jgi:hypothetical protein